MYERHCSSLSGPAHAIVTTTYGVKQNSILNNLEYFHVTSGLPPDIMHNFFEGVAVFEFKSMLSVFIQDLKLFTLTTLNRRIQHFPFGFPDAKINLFHYPFTYCQLLLMMLLNKVVRVFFFHLPFLKVTFSLFHLFLVHKPGV